MIRIAITTFVAFSLLLVVSQRAEATSQTPRTLQIIQAEIEANAAAFDAGTRTYAEMKVIERALEAEERALREAAAACSPFNIRAGLQHVPPTSPAQERVSINYTAPYGPGATTWNFPVTVPAGKMFLITDMFFQDKLVANFATSYRPNFFVLDSVYTLTSVQPSIQFKTPIRLPAGFVLTGSVVNNAQGDSWMNMVVGINGCIVDAP